MRETFTYGSVRGAAGNGGPYRDQWPGLLGPAYELVRKPSLLDMHAEPSRRRE